MGDPQKVLLGSSLHLIEHEEDDDRDLVEETNFEYVCLEILNSIGTNEFKSIYMLLFQETETVDPHRQLAFCRDILDKIERVYNFQFTNILVETEEDCREVHNFLRFVEYDHLDFLVDLFSKLETDPMTIKETEQFLEITKEKIDQFTNTLGHQPQLVLEFLRTYNWDEFKKYLNKIIERNKIEISIELRTKGVTKDASRT